MRDCVGAQLPDDADDRVGERVGQKAPAYMKSDDYFGFICERAKRRTDGMREIRIADGVGS